MFVVGLQLTPADFRRVLSAPKAVIGGTLAQLFVLPLIAWGLIVGLDMQPEVAIGALLLSATPGAGLSNVMAAVSGANVALSVTLTAFASVLSVFTLPGLAAFGMATFLDDGSGAQVPVQNIVVQLALFLALPISVGMWVRSRKEEFALRAVPRANRFAMIAAVVLTVLGAASGQAQIPEGDLFLTAGVGSFAWTALAMLAGYAIGTAIRLPAADRFTYVIEFGARNLALTIVVAVGSIGNLELAIFPGTYGAVGFPLVIAVALLRGRFAGRAAPVGD